MIDQNYVTNFKKIQQVSLKGNLFDKYWIYMGRLWRGGGGWGQRLVVRSEGGEDGRQEGKPVEHPVQHRQTEHLEEGDEDVGGGEGEDDDGQQGGDARVHDGRAKGDQGILCPLSSGP